LFRAWATQMWRSRGKKMKALQRAERDRLEAAKETGPAAAGRSDVVDNTERKQGSGKLPGLDVNRTPP